ncbi:hypothetical protein CC80DRAFT_495678 [Byssothecium circinans]|uniref:WD40 repeat-like protein n=1 Tax=Byssothecium circinans TaxID=147558 RepID=A0A6A5TMQ1_9PLEO|nr:hypothetical protein CC80DRAFT_495678 [Byssothecium circinans]
MDGREIPGFYFDPEKQKYFQIQKNHQLPHAKYSEENIKKRRKKLTIEREGVARTNKLQKERVIRQLDRNALFHASFDREMGSRLTRRLWPGACASGLPSIPETMFEWTLGSPNRKTKLFDCDVATTTIYAVHGDNIIQRRRSSNSSSKRVHRDTDIDYWREPVSEPWDEFARLTSSISSLVYLPHSSALAATTEGSDRPPVVYLSDPDRDGPYVNQQFTPKGTSSIWCSAARPQDSSSACSAPSSCVAAADIESLAVGTSNSLLMFNRSQSGSWDSTTACKLESDVLSIDWLSSRLVALGCRNGEILLYDTRSKGSSHILQHPNPVQSLKRTNHDTRIVCASLYDAIQLYDIRHSRPSSIANRGYSNRRRPGKRRKGTSSVPDYCSQPVVEYQDSKTDDFNRAVDVHPELGLVATLQESPLRSGSIKMFNMWTGNMVKEIKSNPLDKILPKRHSSCLKFVYEGDGGVSLWASWDGEIIRSKW